MSDHIHEALFKSDEAKTSYWTYKQRADIVATFLRTLLDKGPDERMRERLFGGAYWRIIKAFLNHLATRLEAIAETK